MATEKQPIIIKKYANRRLYHTGASTYVTLEDLGGMVKAGEDFVVYDAKSGEDITRSVLTQIIFEQENKEGGQNLLPVTFLRQLIRFYGDSMQTMVPSYLEHSMSLFTREQEKIRAQMSETFGPKAFMALDEQVRTNMQMFTDAMKVFTPFAHKGGSDKGSDAGSGESGKNAEADIDSLKAQMAEMQARLNDLAKK
jgi:polyhydroxyalkanoate synthesis repressor PhaR